METRKSIAIVSFLILLLTVCTGCEFGKEKKEDEDTEKEEGKSYEVVIKNYFNGMVEGDLDKYLSVFPEFMEMDDMYDEDKMEEMVEALEDEYGEKLKVSYEIKKEEKIDKEELKYVEKYIEENIDEDIEISEGYEVKVAATIKGEEDEETATNEMYIYKIDGEWKYFSVSPDKAEDYVDDVEDEE